MSITSETQRKYDPNKGGFSYYTLFHADKGERPPWAQDGDMLEEFGEGGKAYVCSRDAKGRIKWTEKADWDRQTGGGSSEGGGGGSGGGGAEKFVVTLTQDEQTEEWTADKTIAEIVAADAADKIVVCKVAPSGGGMPYELPLTTAADFEDSYVSIFTGVIISASGNGNDSATVYGSYAEGQTNWLVTTTPIPTSSNAPLIVTMTEDQETPGTWVSQMTTDAVFDAYCDGKSVVCKLGNNVALSICGAQHNTTKGEYDFDLTNECYSSSGDDNASFKINYKD